MGRDKDRPGWREPERRRDGGKRRDGARTDDRPLTSTPDQKKYLAALDKAFESGQIGNLIEKIQGVRNGPEVEDRRATPTTPAVANGAVQPAADEAEVALGSDPTIPAPRRSTAGAIAPDSERGDKGDSQSKQKLLAKVKSAVGKVEMERAVDAYVKRYGWPTDFEFLSIALEHRRGDVVTEALSTLERMVAKEKPRRAGLLGARLRTLEELCDDAESRTRAAALRRKL